MIRFDQWMFPDGEVHTPHWMKTTRKRVEGRLTYQYHKYEAALRFCRVSRRRAIDVGAHVGLWSYWMARDFQHVDAFEPIALHQECWRENMRERQNATLHPEALGIATERVAFTTEAVSSGATFMDRRKGAGTIPVRRLDDYALTDVDFIKIDVEGTELDVIEGGIDTIRAYKPIIVVEQKDNEHRHYGRPPGEAVKYLRQIGMQPLQKPMNGDWIMGW